MAASTHVIKDYLETMTMTPAEVAAMQQFDFVRFTVADMHGIARCKALPRRHLEEHSRRGVDMFAGKHTQSGLETTFY